MKRVALLAIVAVVAAFAMLGSGTAEADTWLNADKGAQAEFVVPMSDGGELVVFIHPHRGFEMHFPPLFIQAGNRLNAAIHQFNASGELVACAFGGAEADLLKVRPGLRGVHVEHGELLLNVFDECPDEGGPIGEPSGSAFLSGINMSWVPANAPEEAPRSANINLDLHVGVDAAFEGGAVLSGDLGEGELWQGNLTHAALVANVHMEHHP